MARACKQSFRGKSQLRRAQTLFPSNIDIRNRHRHNKFFRHKLIVIHHISKIYINTILLVGLASNQEFITDLVCIGEAVLAQYSVLGAQPRLLVL